MKITEGELLKEIKKGEIIEELARDQNSRHHATSTMLKTRYLITTLIIDQVLEAVIHQEVVKEDIRGFRIMIQEIHISIADIMGKVIVPKLA
jgi:hypothetical protein